MKSLIAFMSLAILVAMTSAMSLQEFEDDEEQPGDLGWWHVHFHFHFHNMEEAQATRCKGMSCSMCAKRNFHANITSENVDAEFDGCLHIKKSGKQYDVSLEANKQTFYVNSYEKMNEEEKMPCVHPTGADAKGAEMCPHLFKVDLEKKQLCAKLNMNFRAKNTAIEHRIEFGCVKLP